MLFISDSFNGTGTSNTPLPEIHLCFTSSSELSMSAVSSWSLCRFPAFLSVESRAGELTTFLAGCPGARPPRPAWRSTGEAALGGQKSKGKFFLEISLLTCSSLCWCDYFQHSHGPDEYGPEAIMVDPNCRVHIALDNAERGGQGRNIALLNLPLERCVSEIKMLQLRNTPGYTHGHPPPGQCALARPNTTILIELFFSNCAGWCWGRKIRRAADLDCSRAESEPSGTEELCLLLLPCSPREKEWAAPTFALCLGTHKAENKQGENKKAALPMQIWGRREDLLVAPLSPWRKTSGAGRRSKGQGNTELLCCNEPHGEVTPGNWTQPNFMVRTPLGGHILETWHHCKCLSLQTSGTKRWTKEILKYHFGT